MRIRARFRPQVMLVIAGLAVQALAQTQPAHPAAPPTIAPPATQPATAAQPATPPVPKTQPATPPVGPATRAAQPAQQPPKVIEGPASAPANQRAVKPAGKTPAEPAKKALPAEAPKSATAEHKPPAEKGAPAEAAPEAKAGGLDFMSMVFVFMLATFIGIGVIRRVSRLLHTPLMSLTNAISAIAVVGAIIVTGAKHPPFITILGAIALFASTTNIVSGFLITDRMLKMFKTREAGK